jgi:hypothetical protein
VNEFIEHNDISDVVKRETTSLVDAMLIEEQLDRRETLDTAKLLENWSDRRDLWTYPKLLSSLVSREAPGSFVGEECARVLKREADHDRFSTYFGLALALAWPCVETGHLDSQGKAGADYVSASVKEWQDILPADLNRRAYWILAAFDSEHREQHIAERSKWELVVLERDHIKRLPELLNAKKFFAIFKDYCDCMMRWGLDTDQDRLEVYKRLHFDREKRQSAIGAWRAAGANVPSAWVINQGRRLVSAEFLCLGYWMFSLPNDKDPELKEERDRFDKEAQAALPKLLEVVVKLPKLPTAISELVSTYRARFVAYTRREQIAA